MTFKQSRFLLISIFITFSVFSQNNSYNCFSVLVGKDASIDGSVFLAHNEDDGGERAINWYKVPSEDNINRIKLKRGGSVEQVENRFGYLWLQMPNLEFSDTYMNEHSLTITSNGCSSREDKPDLTDGGIGYWLRRMMIERAVTAREAVEIGGRLIEKYGYASSGRTYLIADSYESWMLSVVNGKLWVAQKVPDNHVAIIPNYYTISTIDLKIKSTYLGSPDLVEYAIERGWYNPELDGEFNFRKAYSDPTKLKTKSNIARHWVALNLLSSKHYELSDEFPFSFKPKKKVGLKDMFALLRNHYEGTTLDITETYQTGNPHHQKTMTICSETNQYGFVAQLRSWMSVEVGSVMWVAPRRPCNHAFIPIYSGILFVPESLASTNYHIALEYHFSKISDYAHAVDHPYWYFNTKVKFIDQNYKKRIVPFQEDYIKIEKKLLDNQERFEKKIQKTLIDDPELAKKKLTKFSNDLLEDLIKEAQE